MLTERNSKLLQSNKRPSYFRRSELGIVQRNQHAESTYTNTCDEASSNDVVLVDRASLDDDTDCEDRTGNNNSQTPAQPVSQNAIGKCSEPGTQLEDRGEQSLLYTCSSRVVRVDLGKCQYTESCDACIRASREI